MNTEVFNNVRFVHKGDTEQNWNLAAGFIPLDKELIIYKADENNPFPRIKIGDGITPVQNLPWANNSIFGKELGKSKEVFKEIWSQGIAADIYDKYSQVYTTKESYEEKVFQSTDIPIQVGKTYTLCIESFDNDEKIYVDSICKDTTKLYGGPAISLFYNADYSDETGVSVIGPNALCITFMFSPYYDGHKLYIQSVEKFIGMILIGKMETVPLYETIPNHSLITDKDLLLKDGKLNTTFGKPIIGNTEKKQLVYDFYTYHYYLRYLEELNIYETSYNHSFEENDDIINEIIEGQILTSMTLEIETDEDDGRNTTSTFNYDNVKVMYGDSYHESEPVIIVNSNQTKDEILTSGFVKIDNSKPAFMISLFYEQGSRRVYKSYFSEKASNRGVYNMYFFKHINEIDYIKLPLEALPIDKIKVSPFSDRIPTSYAVQCLIEEKGDKLYDDIYDMVNSRITVDYTPTQYSSNLITSGAVYDAIPFTKGTNSSIALSAGLSVNQAYPTSTGCWIEGRDTRVPSYLSNNYYNINLSIIKTTTGSGSKQTTTTKVLITFKCLDGYFAASDKTRVLNELKSSRNVKFNFKDDTSTYYFMNVYSVTELDSATIQLELSFESGHDRFPTDTAVDAREINEFKIYPYYGTDSHTEGHCTQAYGYAQHVQGKYNIIDTEEKYAHIVGNGESDSERSNAHTLDWEGNAWYAGSVTAPTVILTSPGGRQFRLTVSDGGTLSTVAL